MKLAFLFPGQGSQRVGMGADFRKAFPVAEDLFSEAFAILGYDLALLCEQGPSEELNRTVHTQPALFVTSCVACETLREQCPHIVPFAVAGHSVGEYAAVWAAGSLSFEEGVRLVRERARLMERAAASKPGAMTAVLGLDVETVKECCNDARGVGLVVVANDNGAGQVVISGEAEAVQEAARLALARGAKRTIALPVSGGFHSPLMSEAAAAMAELLDAATFHEPGVPVVSNVTADYCLTADCIRQNLKRQMSEGVRWRESVRRLQEDGVDVFVELGSGEVLSNLVRRMYPGVEAIAVHSLEGLSRAVQLLKERAS